MPITSAPAPTPVPSAPVDDLQALREQVQLLVDRAELTALADRYLAHLDRDRHRDDWFGEVFTDDVRLVFPMGEYRGTAGLAEFQQLARTTFERTHHQGTNYAVDVDGDRAVIRAHLSAVHVKRAAEPGAHFDIGGHYEAVAVRTPDGWRLRDFVFDLVWHAGSGPLNDGGH
ncbi:nuclear transport factor 2 family protein [Streptomyces sp. NPDC090306]|uniref:nuclear transport factor 2 family protein n=1 Tax=Streptomyces sp. NPDC090306 TaxID=3365961 RepID=UPI003804833F